MRKEGFEYQLLRNASSNFYQVILWSPTPELERNVKCETSVRLGNSLLSVPLRGEGGGFLPRVIKLRSGRWY